MGLFSKNKQTDTISVEQRLSNGEFHWKLNPELNATQRFPNYMKFIEKIEDENNIHFGIHREISTETDYSLLLRQGIYDKNNKIRYMFRLTLTSVPSAIDKICLIGVVIDFLSNLHALNETIREHVVVLYSTSSEEPSVPEYEKYYWELLKQSLAIQGLSPNDYHIKGNPCINKSQEQMVRNKYK